jgi:hypothetical protein
VSDKSPRLAREQHSSLSNAGLHPAISEAAARSGTEVGFGSASACLKTREGAMHSKIDTGVQSEYFSAYAAHD